MEKPTTPGGPNATPRPENSGPEQDLGATGVFGVVKTPEPVKRPEPEWSAAQDAPAYQSPEQFDRMRTAPPPLPLRSFAPPPKRPDDPPPASSPMGAMPTHGGFPPPQPATYPAGYETLAGSIPAPGGSMPQPALHAAVPSPMPLPRPPAPPAGGKLQKIVPVLLILMIVLLVALLIAGIFVMMH